MRVRLLGCCFAVADALPLLVLLLVA